MKITKKKLKRIIRDELKTISEITQVRFGDRVSKITRRHLRHIVNEILDEQMVPMYLRGQGDRSAFASGIFEDDDSIDEQEVPLGYGTAAEREKRRLAGIEGDESAFGEQEAGDEEDNEESQ